MNNQISKQKETLAGHLLALNSIYDLVPLFDDFLTLCLCVLSPSAIAGLPWDRNTFEHILDKYSDPALPLDLEKVFSCLLRQIPQYRHPNAYNDVLGDFYEEHILGYDPDMPFCSWDMDRCFLQNKIVRTIEAPGEAYGRRKLRVLDEMCGSGRRLLERKHMRQVEGFYGTEENLTCARMTILNLFLNRMEKAEVLCIEARGDSFRFRTGYAFSRETEGIIEIEREEDSMVWCMMHDTGALMTL